MVLLRSSLRIALVCPYDWSVPGGVKHHVQSLAYELRLRGHHVTIMAPAPETMREKDFINLGPTLAVPYNGSVARIAFGRAATQRVRAALEKGEYDLLHVHEPLSPSVGRIAVTQAAMPVVGTFHAHFDRSAALQVTKPLLQKTFDKLASRIAVSPAAMRTWQQYLGQVPFTIIPNGVGREFFTPPNANADQPPTILFVGRIEHRKGVRQLIRAFAVLKPIFPELRLTIVGPHNGAQKTTLLADLSAQVQKDVTITGPVSQAELLAHYDSATLFCAPSLGGESFGVILLEAMAKGVPIVCSDIEGYRDVVRAGRTAFLVPPGDPLALARALEQLLADPRRRARMAKAGRRHARHYAWERLAKRVEGQYVRVLRRG